MRRARGSGGRFAKKTDDTSKGNSEKKGGGSGIRPSPSGSSSGSEPVPSDSAETWNSSASQQDVGGSQAHNMHEARNHANANGGYQNHGLQASTYHSHLGDRGETGDCSGKQWGSISSNQASQRPLAIQWALLQVRWVPSCADMEDEDPLIYWRVVSWLSCGRQIILGFVLLHGLWVNEGGDE